MSKDLVIPKQPINEGLLDFEQIVNARSSLNLRPYQKKHFGFYMNERRSLMLEEAGVGKTPMACLWVYSRSREDKVIWAMPKSLMVKNYEELLLWSNLEPHQIMLVDGTPAQRDKQIRNREARVFLMGFDSFATNWEALRIIHPETVHLCVDELHLGFSTHGEYNYNGSVFGTKRTLKMYEYLKKGGDYCGMTGTLINGRLTSAYPSINVIEPRYYGSLNNFLTWHAIFDEYGQPFMWKNHDRLQSIIDKHSRTMTYVQAYGSEDKQVFVELCSLSKAQEQAYRQMHERGIVELEQMQLEDSDSPGVNLLRCHEIMQIPEKYGLANNKLDGKEAHLKQHFDDCKSNNSSCIVFETRVEGHEKIKALAEASGLTATIMNGSVTGAARDKADVDFRKGDAQVMVCSPLVAGVGFNWGHVNLILFNSLDFQDTTFIQNYRRALRGDRTETLRIIVLEYRNTLDRKIQMGITRKSQDRALIERTPVIHFTRSGGD